MANTNAPVGFAPVRHLSGGQIRLSAYTIATNYNTALGKGDPVQMTGTGKNIQLAANGTTNAVGVFAGCEYVDASGKLIYSTYWPGITTNTNIKAFVWDDPNILFSIQGDSVAEGDVGALADWATGTPSATTGLSTTSAAVSSATGTSGKSLQIKGLMPTVGNAYGAYAKIEVKFAEHYYLTATNSASGAGV